MTKILFAEDEEQIRKMVYTTLQFTNFTILEAETGYEAVEVALREHPDLIIMDIMMPDLNGIEAARKIKQNPETKHTKIIALSSADEKFNWKNYPFFDAHFPKPFEPLSFMKTVEQLLGL